MRVSKLFLWGQSENISISVKDDIRFGGVFPLSVTRQTVIGLKLVKCVLERVLGVIHSLLVYHKPYMLETTQKKLANMSAKRKCKKVIAIQSDLNRPNENAVEDLSCTTKTQARLKVTHPVSSITSSHILSITITTFVAKE